MKNKVSKPINESYSSKIDIVDNYASMEIRKSKGNRRAKDFGAIFYIFFLENEPTTYSEAITSIGVFFLFGKQG